MDKLISKEEIQRATENGNTFFAQLASQLLDAMRENEQLIKILQECFEEVSLLAKDANTNWLVNKIRIALQPNKQSEMPYEKRLSADVVIKSSHPFSVSTEILYDDSSKISD